MPKTTQITVWQRWDPHTRRYLHNHIEDGWNSNNLPTSTDAKQEASWAKEDWKGRWTVEIDHKVYEWWNK